MKIHLFEGGKGSGNFGHAGRDAENKKGGSAPSDSANFKVLNENELEEFLLGAEEYSPYEDEEGDYEEEPYSNPVIKWYKLGEDLEEVQGALRSGEYDDFEPGGEIEKIGKGGRKKSMLWIMKSLREPPL